VCVSFKQENLSQEDYDAHIKLKDDAMAEKTKDNEDVSVKKLVWTMDRQAVLLCPNTKANCLYYKTKLQVHNFTLYDIKSREVCCYIWNKSEDGLGSEVFAWLQF